MNSSHLYDLVCIGNYTKDTIITPSGTRYVDGGGSRYAAYAAASLGVNVALVTHLAKEDRHVLDSFIQAGIDCFPVYSPKSTLMCLEYPTGNPDVRNLSVKSVAGSIGVDDVVQLQMKSALINSSLRSEVGLDVIRALKEKRVFLAADMQGFVRVLQNEQLVYAPWDEMEVTLPYLDVLKSDAVEAEFLTGESDIFKAARVYADMGVKEIVLTHKDGLLIYADGKFHELGFYPVSLDGRSGRGDTCIGAYVAMRLTRGPLEAGIWAAALTSLKMEKLGLFDRPIRDVENLIRTRYQNVSAR